MSKKILPLWNLSYLSIFVWINQKNPLQFPKKYIIIQFIKRDAARHMDFPYAFFLLYRKLPVS